MEKSIKTIEWKTVHVFISSTFNDMHAERDYLVKKVFPRLSYWCEERKIRLVDIDLRWGVSEADTMNKKVVDTCLKNIDESRPFFICLLGQRRGWVPKKDDISADTYKDFSGIDGYAGNASVTEMEILHALIDPLHKNRPRDEKKKEEFYEPVKHAFFYLRDDSYLKSLPSSPNLLREIYTNESEENLSERENADKELENWREIKIPATKRPVRHYTAQWNSAAITPEIRLPMAGPSEDLPALKKWRELWKNAGIILKDSDNEIPANLLDKAISFNSSFTKGRLGEFQIENKELGDVIFSDLQEAIRERFHDQIEKVESGKIEETDLQKEIDQQEQFVSLNSTGFIERAGDFIQIDAYAANDSRKLFVLTAEAGMGKSMFLAKWVERHREKVDPGKNESIHFRFIGQSDKSTSFYNVWHTLLEEIKENTGKLVDEVTREADGSETKVEMIPVDPIKLHNSLPNILKRIGTKGKTIIVLDALNQLETGLTELNWLPSELPLGIKMIVSFKHDKNDSDAGKLYQRVQNSAELAEIKPFSGLDEKGVDVRIQLIDGYLNQYLKKLDSQHINALLEIEGSKNPLFLKIILSELRIFGSFLNIKEKIHKDFGNNPLSAFLGVLKRLENDTAYTSIPPVKAVPFLFGLLAHARHGLSAEELADMFVNPSELEQTSDKKALTLETVHFFLRQIRPFSARKEGRFDFYYESFKIAASERYVLPGSIGPDLKRTSQQWHCLLAGYFRRTAIEHEEDFPKWRSNRKRALAELPYHLAESGDQELLYQLLSDLGFLNAKLFALGIHALIEDFSFIDGIKRKDSSATSQTIEKSDILQIRDVMRGSAHILFNDPKQLPGQIALRLLPKGGEWAQRLLKQVGKFKGGVWLKVTKSYTQYPISTLDGHVGSVFTVGWVVPNRIIATGCNDYNIRIWDIKTGTIRKNLVGHEGAVHALIGLDGDRTLISGAADGTVRIWNIESGIELHRWECSDYRGRRPDFVVRHLALTSDGVGVVVGGGTRKSPSEVPDMISLKHDCAIRLLRLPDLRLVCRFEGPSELVTSLIINKNKNQVLCATQEPSMFGDTKANNGKDASIGVWDISTGKEIDQINLLGQRHETVSCLALTPNGRLLSGTNNDHRMGIWRPESYALEAFISGQNGATTAIALIPNKEDLIASGAGGIVRIWDINKKHEISRYAGHIGSITSLESSSNGELLASASDDGTVKIWGIEK